MVGRGIPGELLRRHVGGRTDRHTRGSNSRIRHCRIEGLGYSKVGDERMRTQAKNISGLYVAVNDSVGVRISQSVDNIAENSHDVAYRHRAVLLESGAKRLTLD